MLEEILVKIEEILNEHKVKYYILSVVQSYGEGLVAPFLCKYAAVNAGLC